MFDLNTVYKYEELLGMPPLRRTGEDKSFIWDNFMIQEEQINEYDLSIFIREEENLYRKFTETHYQRAYTLAQVKACLEAGGMEFVTTYDAFTKDAPGRTATGSM